MAGKGKKVLTTVLVLALLGGAAWGSWKVWQKRQEKQAEAGAAASTSPQAQAYTQVTIGRGTIQNTVKATGSLAYSNSQTVSVPYGITPDEVLVEKGQAVKAGEPLMTLDTEALRRTVLANEADVAAAQSALARQAAQYEEESTITSAFEGRIKAIHAAVGQPVQEASAQPDGLLTLSLDGRMRVVIPAGELAVGQALTVLSGQTRYAGTVDSIADGQATVTFPDTRTVPGDVVTVLDRTAELGTGPAEINHPYAVTSLLGGNISKVSVAVDQQVTSRTALFEAGQMPRSLEYALAQQDLEDANDLLTQTRAALAAGIVAAPADGVVGEVSAQDGKPAEADSVLLKLLTGQPDQMVVAVDELDISQVVVGQAADVAMDALSGREVTGHVTGISHLGTFSSGVSTFDVTLALQAQEGLMAGMNGTATISVNKAEDVVLVPLSAVQSMRSKQMVFLYDPAGGTTPSGMPGIRTEITTGLSDANYAEVLSGLNEGDVVLVPQLTVTQVQRTFQEQMGISPGVMGQPGTGTGPGSNRRDGN